MVINNLACSISCGVYPNCSVALQPEMVAVQHSYLRCNLAMKFEHLFEGMKLNYILRDKNS